MDAKFFQQSKDLTNVEGASAVSKAILNNAGAGTVTIGNAGVDLHKFKFVNNDIIDQHKVATIQFANNIGNAAFTFANGVQTIENHGKFYHVVDKQGQEFDVLIPDGRVLQIVNNENDSVTFSLADKPVELSFQGDVNDQAGD